MGTGSGRVEATDHSEPPLIRWWIGGLLMAIGAILQTIAFSVFAENPTFRKMSMLLIWPAILFACLLWWVFGNRISLKARLIPVAVLLIMAAISALIFRIDGSDGNMVPVVNYRWSPTPVEKARQYWQDQKAAIAVNEELREASSERPVEPLLATPDDWPDFRGPLRDGIYRGPAVRLNWETEPPVLLWKHALGLGWSSFAVLGERAITMEQRDAQEVIACYRLSDGSPLWLHGYDARFTAVAVNGGDGPHATPVIDGDSTFALGGTGILSCLSTTTGKLRWTRNILVDAGTPDDPAENLEWGVSAAPLVVNDLLITIAGGTQSRSVIAYNKTSGDIVWAAGDFPASYCAPRLETLNGLRQLLIFHGTGIAGFDPVQGRQLWNFPWENIPKVNAAQPILLDEHSLVIGSGYGKGAVRLNFSVQGDKWDIASDWKSTRFKLKFNDAVLINEHLFGLDDGILTCLDPETGQTRWKARGFGYGQLLGINDQHLLALSEGGEVVLVSTNPKKFHELGRISALNGTTWNHPVIAHQKLLVRNGTTAACFDMNPTLLADSAEKSQ